MPNFAPLLFLTLFTLACSKPVEPPFVYKIEFFGLHGPVKSATWYEQTRENEKGHVEGWENKVFWKKDYFNHAGYITKREGEFQEEYSTYHYDLANLLVTTYSYSKEGQLESRFIRWFDEKGRYVFEEYFDPKGNLRKSRIYKNTKDENIKISNVFDANGKLIGKGEWVYDDRGMWIEKNSDEMRVVFEYNINGELIFEETSHKNANGTSSHFQKDYLGHWHPIEKCSYKANGILKSKQIYTYEYDEVGNWITRTTHRVFANEISEEKVSYQRMLREIEYY